MARGQTRPPPRSQTALRSDWMGTQRVRAAFPYRRNLLPTRSQGDPRETDISGWGEYALKIRQAKSVRIAHIFAMNRCNTPARRFNCRLNCDNVSSGRTRSPWRPCGLNPSHAMRWRRSRYLPSCFVRSTLDVVSADIDRIHARFSSETSQRLCAFFRPQVSPGFSIHTERPGLPRCAAEFQVPWRSCPCPCMIATERVTFNEPGSAPAKGSIMPSTLSHDLVLPETGFLRQSQVLAFVPISKSTLWRRVQAGTFPAPVKLSSRITAWRAEDVRRWIEAQGPQT